MLAFLDSYFAGWLGGLRISAIVALVAGVIPVLIALTRRSNRSSDATTFPGRGHARHVGLRIAARALLGLLVAASLFVLSPWLQLPPTQIVPVETASTATGPRAPTKLTFDPEPTTTTVVIGGSQVARDVWEVASRGCPGSEITVQIEADSATSKVPLELSLDDDSPRGRKIEANGGSGLRTISSGNPVRIEVAMSEGSGSLNLTSTPSADCTAPPVKVTVRHP